VTAGEAVLAGSRLDSQQGSSQTEGMAPAIPDPFFPQREAGKVGSTVDNIRAGAVAYMITHFRGTLGPLSKRCQRTAERSACLGWAVVLTAWDGDTLICCGA